MTEAEVRALLIERMEACCNSCNSHHINHVEGQVRAIVAVLSGEMPPCMNGSTEHYLRAAGIAFVKHADGTIDLVNVEEPKQ